MSEIQSTISNLTNIEMDKIRIRVELNDNDEVIHIIVIVDDETTAEIISSKVNEMDCQSLKGEHDDSSTNNPYCEGILKYVKSARVVEVVKSSSVPPEDDDNIVWIIVGTILLGVIVISVIIIVIISIVCHKKKQTKKSSSCEVIVADRSVYVVEDSVAMTELSNPQTVSDSPSKPESDVTILQAFQK